MSLKPQYFNDFFLACVLVIGACSSVAFAGTPTLGVSLSNSTIAPGSSTRLTVTVDNSANDVGVTDVTLSMTLPTGVTLLPSPNAVASCGDGQFSATGGGTSITASGYRMGTTQTCTFEMDITSSTAGSHTIATGDLSTSAGTTSSVSTTLTVDTSVPVFTMAFSQTTVAPNEVTTLTYTIDNSLNASNYGSLFARASLIHTLPDGIVIADAPNVAISCTFALETSVTPGGDTFSYTLHVDAGTICTLSVDVVGTSVGVYNTSTSEMTIGGSNSAGVARATLTVERQFMEMSVPGFAIPGESISLDFAIFNTDRSNDITGLSFTLDLNAALSGLAATALPATGFCGAGSTISGTSNLTISNGSISSGDFCTFSVTVLVPSNASSGSYTLTTSSINLTQGAATTKTAASASLQVLLAPSVTLTFIDDPVSAGDDVTARFTVTNTDVTNTATAISFRTQINSLVSGMTVKTLPAANSCGSGSHFSNTSDGPGGENSYISVGNASLAAGANCTFDVILTVPSIVSPGTFSISTNAGTATVSGNSLPIKATTADLIIEAAPGLVVGVVEENAVPGDTININFSLLHSANSSADATGVGFTLDLNAALSGLAAVTLPSDGFCGTGSTVTGSTSLTVSNVTVAVDEQCDFSVTATVPSGAAPGTITLNSSEVTATVGSLSVASASASDSFVISGLSLTHSFLTNPVVPGTSPVIRYTISNDTNSPAATDIQFSHDLNQVISGMTATSLPSTPCNGSSAMTGPTNLAMSAGELAPGESCSFDVTVSVPSSASDGIYGSITTDMSATVNSANTASAASSSSLTVETLTVSISSSESSPVSSSPFSINIAFSRDVTGFDIVDLTVSNGSASNLSGSGKAYTADITPTADGTVTVDLAANTVFDSVFTSYQNTAASQFSIAYESSPTFPTPSLVIGSPDSSETNSGPVNYAVTYTNGDEINLSSTAITLNTTGTASASVAVSDGTTSTPTITLSSITGDGTLGLTIASGTARNGDQTAGSAGPSATFSVDNTAPAVTIVDQVANPFNDAFQAEITFTENVTGFTVDDLSFTNANLSDFSGSNNFYTVTVTPVSDGQVTGSLAANSAQDSAGNGNTAAPGFGMIYDATAPTVVISSDSAAVNSAFTATFTFSEDVTDFTVSDISSTNSNLSSFSATSASVYTVLVTPTSEGTVTLDVSANVATDSASNNNTAAQQYSVTYDTSGPTVSITTPNNLVQGSAPVTFTFTEDVTGFTVNDISVGNGAASNFVSTSASVYTATISATNDGTVTVDVPSASATDAAGNSNTAASQISFVSDSTAPSLTSTLPADDASGVAFGSDLVFTFSETVQLNTGSNGTLSVHELSPSNNVVDTLSFSVSSGSLTGPGTVSISSNTLTLDLDSDLNVGTRYAVQMSAGLLTDTAGNSFVGITNNTDWNFVTSPGVRLSSNQTSLTEELTEQATVTLALIDAQNQPFTTPTDVTLNMSFSGSTATENTDFSVTGLTAGALTISANASGNSFTVTAINDSVADDNESLEIAVDSVSTNNAVEIQEQAISIAIVENAAPTLTSAPTSISLSEDVKGRIDFSDTVITDAEDDTLTLTASISTGRLVSPKGSAGGVTVTPTGPTAIQLTGQGGALTSFLDFPDAIAILPPRNHVSSMTLSLVLSDGTEQADTQNIPVSITPVNDAPRLITGTIAEFDMTGGSISSALVFTETADNRTMTVTLDAGNWVNSDLDTFGGSTDETLYSDSDAATNTVTVSFDQKVNLESLVYFFNVGSAPQSLTLTPIGHRGEAISISSSDFTVDDAGVSIDLRGWLGITSFTITSSAGGFAPGLDTIVYSLPPADFSFQEDQAGNLDFSSLSLSDEDSSAPTLKISADSGTLSLPAGRPVSSIASLSGSVSVSIENNVITITGTIDDINSYLSDSSNVQYTPSSDESGSDVATITITVNDNDGSGDVELQSITVDVTSVNDAPTISNLDGDSVSYVQNGGAVAIDASSNAVAADVDDDSLDGGSITVAITAGGASSEDLLSVSDVVTLASLNNGADVSVDGTVVGTLGNAVSEGNDFVVNFNSEATLSRVSSLLNALIFENTSTSSPTEGDRTIAITLNDGEDDSETAQVTLTVTALDEDSSISWLGKASDFTIDYDSASNPFTHYTLTLQDTGTDGVDTTITGISFDVVGTIDFDTIGFVLTHITYDGDTPNYASQNGVYNNGVVSFSSSIVVENGSNSDLLQFQVYLAQTTGLVDQSAMSVSLDPTEDIQIADYSSMIGSTDVLSTSDTPLTLDISATEVIFSTEPAGSVSGIALTTQPVLRAQDTHGNLDTDFTSSVSLTESSDGALIGNTVTASAGIATFNSLVYTATQDNESFVLKAYAGSTSTSMQPSSSQVVSDVVATRVVFDTQPSPVAINAETATDFTTVPVLTAVDAQSLVDEDYNEDVILSETNGPGTALLSADNDSDTDSDTVTLSFSAGQVSVDGLNVTYTVAGSGNETFNLLASSGSLSSATSSAIEVNDLPTLDGAPDELIVTEDLQSDLDLSDIVFADTDGNDLTLSFTVTAGTLFTASGDGITNGVTITGNDSATLTLQGSVTDLTSLLSSATEVSYLSAENDDSDATLTIVANDGQVDSAASNISLAISPVNDAPTISGAADDTVEQGAQYSFTPNTIDVDGDTLTFSIQNQPEWTSFDTSSGELSGVPENEDVGTHSDIQITVSDGEFSASLNSFSITVTDVNDAPEISGTPGTQVDEDTVYSFTPSALDVDGDSLTFSVVNLPSWAAFNESSGTVSGIPGNDDVGTYSGIVISVSDGQEIVSLSSFSITVNQVNDAPVISGTPNTSVLQGSNYEFAPSVSDIDSTVFTWSIVNMPEWASFDTSNGVLTGTPSSANVGVYSDITISVSDGQLSDTLSAFSIEVVNVNDAPSISGSPATIAVEDTQYEFIPSASDPDGDTLTFSIVGQPDWTTFDTLTGGLSGIPENEDVGEHSGIEISVSDGIESTSLAPFSITVQNVNDAPEISGIPQSAVAAGSDYLFEPVATDIDSDELEFSITGQPLWTEFDSQSGRLTGTPSSDDIGTYENIVISVSDGELSASLDGFSIEVRNNNSAPIAEGQMVNVLEDSSLIITLEATDSDGDTLVYSIVESVTSGSIQLNGNAVSYAPNPDVSGVTDSFTFIANDGQIESNIATVSIEITPVNDAPQISGTPSTQVKVLKAYSFAPQVSDVDSESLTLSIQNRPDWATFDNNSGVLSGTPSAEDAGVYGGVKIIVSDGELEAELPAFDIEVLVNSAPQLLGTPDVVAQVGEAYQFTPQATDPDGDELRFTISNLPSWASFDSTTGALTGIPLATNIGNFTSIVISVTDGLNSVSLPAFNIRVCDVCDNLAPEITGIPETTVTAGSSYEFIPEASDANEDALQFSVSNMPSWASFDAITGRLAGTPEQSDVGVYSNIIVSVSDGEDSVSLPAFSVEVLSSNSAPTISGSPSTTAASGVLYSFTPSASDADDDDLLFSIANKPGWASFNPNSGRLRGTPDKDDVGLFSDIVIKVTDGVNDAVSLPAFSIEVTSQNSAPVISGEPRTKVTQGKVYRFSPSASDADGDALTFSVLNLPDWLSFNEQTGNINGTPLEEDIGEYDNIELSVSDGTEQVSLPPFSLSVVSSNIAPVATNSAVSTSEDNAVTIVADAVDENQDELSFTITNSPLNGTLSATDSGWIYSPSANFNGEDSFDYSVSDGELTSEQATITVSVSAVNDKPDAINDQITQDQLESGIYTLDVLANDIDPDIATNGDVLSLQRVSTSLGVAQIVDNQLEVNLGATFIGTVNLTYSIRDAEAKNDTARVSLTINGVEDINAPQITVPADLTVNASGLITRVNPGNASAVDAEGNQLPVSLVDDELDFPPGSHTLYWQAEDSYGSVSTDEQMIIVLPIVSLASAETTAEGTTVDVEFLLNGEAPSYPYEVNYTVSGSAEGNGVDYSGGTGTAVFTQGQSSIVSFEVHIDSEIEVDETIIVSLNDGQNIGANSSATITISESNIAPTISLSVLQDSIPTFVVAQDAGIATIEADVADANLQDSLSLDWTAEGISNLSTSDDRFEFDPSVLDTGRYEVSLYVNDDGDPILDATESVVFEIVFSRNELSDTEDTDGDLIPDAQEGYGDSDGDGIPDYLDAIDDCNVIASQAEEQSQFLVESEPGVCMRVGDTASQNGSNGVQVVVDGNAPRQSRTNQYGERVALLANDLPEDRNYENVGGIFDFVLYDLQTVGQVVRVVLPQSQPIPENALYRKYNPDTELWRSFVSNDNNKVFSAPGAEGNCPSPGANNYKPGLTAGHWCVQLLISDGGPNDQDGSANAAIADPGGVAVFVSDNIKPVAVDDSVQMSWNSEVEIDVLGNDSDADGDELIIRSAEASIGEVEITTNGLLYTARTGYSGRDTISYFIGDGNGGRANAKVALEIRGNRAPGASDDFAETDNLTPIEIDVLANDIDVDGDELSVVSATANSGSVTVLADNQIRYTPVLSFSGLDIVTYEVVDTNGASDTAMVSVFVNGNESPVAVADSIVTEYETSITVNVLSNDSDPDGDTLMVVAAAANNGSVIVNDDYTITYRPDAGFSGSDAISYTISDGALEASSQVTVTVNPEPVEVVKVTGSSGGTLTLWWWLLSLLLWGYRSASKGKNAKIGIKFKS